MAGYSFIFFDCDSTLTRIEGVDELARLKGVSEEVADLTRQAMDGLLPLEDVYARRLALLQPTRRDLRAVEIAYQENLVGDARAVVACLHALARAVFIISGGLLPAVVGLGRTLGIPASRVHAVDVQFDQLSGRWWDYHAHRYGGNPDERYLRTPPALLGASGGKAAVIRRLLTGRGRSLLVGDGVTDLEARPAVDLFAGFGGVVRREVVAREADVYISAPELAGLLPLAVAPQEAQQLRGAPHQAVFDRGIELVRGGSVAFRDPSQRTALMEAYRGFP
jgi:phosphoserine phosphatase